MAQKVAFFAPSSYVLVGALNAVASERASLASGVTAALQLLAISTVAVARSTCGPRHAVASAVCDPHSVTLVGIGQTLIASYTTSGGGGGGGPGGCGFVSLMYNVVAPAWMPRAETEAPTASQCEKQQRQRQRQRQAPAAAAAPRAVE
jgi:hypothetical protein